MRLGVAWQPGPNAQYRAFQPMRAMARRGHDVFWPPSEQGEMDLERLRLCDVVHVYRRCDDHARRVVAELLESGTAVTFDIDEDLTALPKAASSHKQPRGVEGRRQFMGAVKLGRMAQAFTTTNELLAEKYRDAGVEPVEVIGNYLVPDADRPRVEHDGIVIGWLAGAGHRADAKRLRVREILRQVLAAHPQARVECIGVDLGLTERYRHTDYVDFEDLPERMGAWDIAISPLADLPLNRARSDVKLKEYAACGVAWLASPVGPHRGLGEEQGGRLVPNDGWVEAIGELVVDDEARRRLARNGVEWARTQTVEAVADRWEDVFATAAADTRGPDLTRKVAVRLRPPPPVGAAASPARRG
jgi:glycosyltransferase involved in cell wall biosynthesis